jgi:hypothetical protein
MSYSWEAFEARDSAHPFANPYTFWDFPTLFRKPSSTHKPSPPPTYNSRQQQKAVITVKQFLKLACEWPFPSPSTSPRAEKGVFLLLFVCAEGNYKFISPLRVHTKSRLLSAPSSPGICIILCKCLLFAATCVSNSFSLLPKHKFLINFPFGEVSVNKFASVARRASQSLLGFCSGQISLVKHAFFIRTRSRGSDGRHNKGCLWVLIKNNSQT